MPLAQCIIQDLLTDYMNAYVSQTTFTFDQLKIMLVKKEPILEIHSKLIDELTNSKNTDIAQARLTAENQIYAKQLEEDESQAKSHAIAQAKDDEEKACLTRELNRIQTLVIDYNTRCIVQQYKVDKIRAQNAKMTKMTKTNNLKSYASSDETAALTLIEEYKSNINTLAQDTKTLKAKLLAIQERSAQRLELQLKLEHRKHARSQYKVTNQDLEKTLTAPLQLQLAKSIQDQLRLLDSKCSELINDGLAMNFAVFLDVLQQKLNTLCLPPLHIEALRTIIKLLNRHFTTEHEVASLRDSHTNKAQALCADEEKLVRIKSKTKELQQSIEPMVNQNKTINEQNLQLTETLKYNNKLQKRFGSPIHLLLALSCLSVIPLLLTNGGVIAIPMNPLYFYILLSTPPLLFFLATLTCGVLSFYYNSKAKSNESTIKTNLTTRTNNEDKISVNNQLLKRTQDETIPNLEAKIKADKIIRDRLQSELTRLQTNSSQALEQAKEINPVSSTDSGFFTPSSTTEADEDGCIFVDALDHFMTKSEEEEEAFVHQFA